MAWNASLLGANTVKSDTISTVDATPALTTAPMTLESPKVVPVVEAFWGGTRKLSITWITPPSNLMSWMWI